MEQLTAPPSVDVLRSPNCPVCFSPSDFSAGVCEVCGAPDPMGPADAPSADYDGPEADEPEPGEDGYEEDPEEAAEEEGEQELLPQRNAVQHTTCPVCASVDSFHSGRCGVCGAAKPPVAFMDPDLSAAHKMDEQRRKALEPAPAQGPSEVICSMCGSLFPTPASSQGPHLDAPASPAPLLGDDPLSALSGIDTIDMSAYEPGTTCPVCGRGTLVPLADDDEELPEATKSPPGARVGAARKALSPKCRWCPKPATVVLVGAETSAKVPSCASHVARGRVFLEDTAGDQLLGVRKLQRPRIRRLR